MAQKNRMPLANLSNSENSLPSRRRPRDDGDIADAEKPLVEVQRFTLVSRGAPPVARKRARYSTLLAPPGLAAHLGDSISVCRCSECPGAGKNRRLCGRDTEMHGEYALLLNMVSNFEAECPSRIASGTLVSDACCREKSAFFILGPGRRTVGYVAAVVAANKKVIRQAEDSSISNVASQTKPSKAERKAAEAPHILQIYVEPEFRRQGLGTAALELLLQDHDNFMIDEPTWPVIKMLESLEYTTAGESDGPDGRPVVRFVQNHFAEQK